MPTFESASRWMFVGNVEYDFSGKTIAEVATWLGFTIDEVADKINSTTCRLDARARFIAEADAAVIEPREMTMLDDGNAVGTSAVEVFSDVPFADEEVLSR